MSMHLKSPQECITTIIIIIIITKKTAQPMRMAPAPTQLMKIAPYIPKILHRVRNKKLWIITLQTRHQE